MKKHFRIFPNSEGQYVTQQRKWMMWNDIPNFPYHDSCDLALDYFNKHSDEILSPNERFYLGVKFE